MWLQGGPGGSSLFGLFNENGPIVVDESGAASRRKVTWNLDYHMLYIDNPVSSSLKSQALSFLVYIGARKGSGHYENFVTASSIVPIAPVIEGVE